MINSITFYWSSNEWWLIQLPSSGVENEWWLIQLPFSGVVMS